MKILKTLTAILLTILLALPLTAAAQALEPVTAAPEWEDFTDVTGHWAEPALKKGFDSGQIKGFEDNTLRPDDTITLAQMITILTRVLNATQSYDVSGWNMPQDAWYYEAAGKAAFLGLVYDTHARHFDDSMTRQEALAMLAEAFALVPANADTSVLDAFSDVSTVDMMNRLPIAALVKGGFVEGSAGALNANGGISRAEFLTVLYRITDKCLLFDCAADNVRLSQVKAETVVLKAHTLKSLSIEKGCSIGTLVIDCGEAAVSLGTLDGIRLDTVRFKRGNSLTLTDSIVKNIEITGVGKAVTIGGAHENLTVVGANNTVTIPESASLADIKLLGSDNKIDTYEGARATVTGNIAVSGTGNYLALAGSFGGDITDSGNTNSVYIGSSDPISKVTISGNGGWTKLFSDDIGAIEVTGDYGTIVLVSSQAPSTQTSLQISGKGNRFYLEFGNLFELGVTGRENVLEIDGTVENMTIDGYKTTITGSGSATNLTLNAGACTINIAFIINLTDNSRDYDIDRILALVTNTYKGDFTLTWAEEHDYEDYEKEIWINAKNYSSTSQYLIWVNLAMQRVNIFEGSKNNWTLVRSCIVGSGALKTPTILGVFTISYKQAAGWTTSTYTCKPVVAFYGNSGYAFHSRLYYPNSDKLTDASIGFPVSHGCLRMYDEDIAYIYDNIPIGTTVVVH